MSLFDSHIFFKIQPFLNHNKKHERGHHGDMEKNNNREPP